MLSTLKGTGVALVTPFTSKSKIDFDGLKSVISHVSPFVDYLVICGTTGEAPTLSSVEKRAVLDFSIENNNYNLPLVYGIGGNCTQNVLDALTDVPEEVRAILSVSPAYNKPSQAGIVSHFRAIADKSKQPILLYNVPGRTSSNMTWQTTIALSSHQNIIGIKEASGDITQAMAIIREKKDNFLLISGDDLLTPALMAIGASGVISVLANAFPAHFQKLMSGSTDQLLDLLNINEMMYEEGNPTGIKEVLHQMDVCGNDVRSPLLRASSSLSAKIKEELSIITSTKN